MKWKRANQNLQIFRYITMRAELTLKLESITGIYIHWLAGPIPIGGSKDPTPSLISVVAVMVGGYLSCPSLWRPKSPSLWRSKSPSLWRPKSPSLWWSLSSPLPIPGFFLELLDLVPPESSFFGLSFVLVVPGAAFTLQTSLKLQKRLLLKYSVSFLSYQMFVFPFIIHLFLFNYIQFYGSWSWNNRVFRGTESSVYQLNIYIYLWKDVVLQILLSFYVLMMYMLDDVHFCCSNYFKLMIRKKVSKRKIMLH
jgi:hypothetical protein